MAPGERGQAGVGEQSDKGVMCIISLVITTVYTSAAGHLSTSKGAERKVKPKWVLAHPLRENVLKGGEREEERVAVLLVLQCHFLQSCLTVISSWTPQLQETL